MFNTPLIQALTQTVVADRHRDAAIARLARTTKPRGARA